MIYMCLMDYCEDRNRIAAVRPHHQAYLFALIDQGKLISGGSFLPDSDGGLFLYEAGTLHDAERLVQDDPYIREGLIATYKLREYEVHGINRDLLRVTGHSAFTSESEAKC